MTQPSASQKNPDLPPDSSQHNIADEQDIIQFFQSHHLSQYTDRFLEEGFDQIRSLYEVTESDLIYMGVKRGHRRLIQRAIANAKGVPPMAPLIIDYGFGVVNDQPYGNPIVYAKFNSQVEQTPPPAVHTTSSGLSSNEDDGSAGESTPSRTWKRKYQRHPKPDQHAPVKPSSAYVMFSNQVRAELKDQNMSFTELAKIVGERWKHLSPTAKERYERNAMLKKEEYIIARAKYEQTQEYQAYQDYLDSFRAKHEGSGRSVPPRLAKRKQPSQGFSTMHIFDKGSRSGRESTSSSTTLFRANPDPVAESSSAPRMRSPQCAADLRFDIHSLILPDPSPSSPTSASAAAARPSQSMSIESSSQHTTHDPSSSKANLSIETLPPPLISPPLQPSSRPPSTSSSSSFAPSSMAPSANDSSTSHPRPTNFER